MEVLRMRFIGIALIVIVFSCSSSTVSDQQDTPVTVDNSWEVTVSGKIMNPVVGAAVNIAEILEGQLGPQQAVQAALANMVAMA